MAPTCTWRAGLGTAWCGLEDATKPTRRPRTPHPCGWRRSTSWTADVLGEAADGPLQASHRGSGEERQLSWYELSRDCRG